MGWIWVLVGENGRQQRLFSSIISGVISISDVISRLWWVTGL